MAKYVLNKLQVKRLLEDKPVIDCRGRKYLAEKKLKEILQMIDERDLYHKFEIYIENGEIDIVARRL